MTTQTHFLKVFSHCSWVLKVLSDFCGLFDLITRLSWINVEPFAPPKGSLGVPGASVCLGCSTCVRFSTKHSQKPDGAKTHRGTVFINLIYQYIEIFLNNLIS